MTIEGVLIIKRKATVKLPEAIQDPDVKEWIAPGLRDAKQEGEPDEVEAVVNVKTSAAVIVGLQLQLNIVKMLLCPI